MRLSVHPNNNVIAAMTDVPNNCVFSWHYPNVSPNLCGRNNTNKTSFIYERNVVLISDDQQVKRYLEVLI
jgi:hypothetical protein